MLWHIKLLRLLPKLKESGLVSSPQPHLPLTCPGVLSCEVIMMQDLVFLKLGVVYETTWDIPLQSHGLISP